jgi:stage V sporulation protein AA
METAIYIRMRNKVQSREFQKLLLKDLAQIIAPESHLKTLQNLPIYQIREEDKNFIVIDVIKVIDQILKVYPEADIQTIGPAQTLVEVIYRKKKVSPMLFIGVWLLLFIGAALTIMNFHEDVSMGKVHRDLYRIITGKENHYPLIFQIPYSLGLGVGMILFFNHVFQKRINEEPSPLEVEMFNYQQDLDQYVIIHENKESMKKLDDD